MIDQKIINDRHYGKIDSLIEFLSNYKTKNEVIKNQIKNNIFDLERTRDINYKYNRTGDYYPYTYLSEKDSINYPYEIELYLQVDNLFDVSEMNNYVDIDFTLSASTNYPPNYVPLYIDSPRSDIFEMNEIDTLEIAPLNKFLAVKSIDFENGNSENAYAYIGDYEWDNLYQSYIYYFDSDKSFKRFHHKWELKDYPFDTQKIRFPVIAWKDSSVVNLKALSLDKKLITADALPEGFKIDDINFVNEFVEAKNYVVSFSPEDIRNIVYPLGVFEIVISRSGFMLFVKLFMATFLAVIMSLSTFYINKRNFWI